MSLETPRSISEEHDEIHQDLTRISDSGGRVGKAAEEVAGALHKHFGNEEKYAMPPLGLLKDLSEGKEIQEKEEAIGLTDKLEELLPQMLGEHKEIVKKLGSLREIAEEEQNDLALSFVNRLSSHAKTEEEILYPTSILIGKYLKGV